MTWDEIRAAYPNQRIFVSAVEESFDGDLVHYRPIAALEAVPADEWEAFRRMHELEIVHEAAIVNADTSSPELVGLPSFDFTRICESDDEADDLALPAMRLVKPQISRPASVD